MKEERLQNWDKKEELDCLLFFALRIRELVFDYTLDTFKYPALNSTASCKEAIELINEIESNIISVKSLEPIVAELQWKIRQDYVVKKMVGEDIQYYLNFGDIANHKEIKLKLQLLYNKISPNKYCLVTEDLLEKIIAENKEKKTISKLAATYVSSLINLGFSQSYIYITTNNHFFSTTSINNLDSLRNFFSCFTRVQETYTVILRCSNLFLELSKSSFAFRSEISNTITDDISKLDKHGFTRTKQKNESFFIANEIKALDPVSAKTEAERRINKLSKLFVFYHHKKHPTWLSKALVINNKSKNTFLLDNRVSPMSKGRDLEPQKAAIELNKLIRGLELDSESFAKYDRAIDLHGLSIENKYIENQLLQNWIAFETLLVGYSSKSKIDQVLDHLVPFLKYKYIER
ncbi:MAG: hypothetical protein K0R51_82, partial [Cytophagaceae bacterium]|nr:hypothetical protein [Cytophagaceae bacterium]